MLAAQAYELMGTGLFVDVRESYEYEAGHVEGSVHIPIGAIPSRWQELDDGRAIVVVCQVGQRSALVTRFLQDKGLDAHNLEGGLEAWTLEGLDLAPSSSGPRIVDGEARDLSGEKLR